MIIADRYPEFSYEANRQNLEQAIQRLEIPYPVTQDNQGVAWEAYQVRYWLTLFLVDKGGNIRYQRIGEGRYDEIEAAFLALLAEE
jgi:hypothetical protein